MHAGVRLIAQPMTRNRSTHPPRAEAAINYQNRQPNNEFNRKKNQPGFIFKSKRIEVMNGNDKKLIET
jgi:hypothetical protein